MKRSGKGKPTAERFEKMGAFYLGRLVDADQRVQPDELLLYDAKDLTTHAVCLGMTGSGKTGLCVSLIEEAAIDGIPAIVIDPKGDLANLLLTFPALRPEDFEPWIDPAEAANRGQSVDEFAAATAKMWREGLAGWGEDGARIQRLKDAAEFSIYTPGNAAGRPLSVLRSFSCPSPAVMADDQTYRDHLSAAVSGLLGLLGLDADPLLSREHILLSTILDQVWRGGQDLDLAALIHHVQAPPFETIGVMAVDDVFPAKERFALAMRLNNLLASPGFAAWMQGEPLSAQSLLWTEAGRPRVSVISIAHLSDQERMFLVTTLLGEVVSWMRGQPGSSSLRALIYMDEVFGYLPPTANPPSKRPLLTLLKQARAFGVGLVLATQNPVDLDYKALSNAGTWLLGRLQTQRDKIRVLEGLEGVSASAGTTFDRAQVDRILSGLHSRVFLLNNVHDDAPALFHTRWAMSYLRGPLTQTQVSSLCASLQSPSTPARGAVAMEPKTPAPSRRTGESVALSEVRPPAAAGIDERFWIRDEGSRSPREVLYRPYLTVDAEVHYAHQRLGIDLWRKVRLVAPAGSGAGADVWADAEAVDPTSMELLPDPSLPGRFEELPAAARRSKNYVSWARSLKNHLYRHYPLTLWVCPGLKLHSVPGESRGVFVSRVRQAGRERRDLELAKLRKKYAPRLERARRRLETALQRADREQSQYKQQKMQTAISFGATLLGAFLGRKAVSVSSLGRATTAMRGAGRVAREKGDVRRAAGRVEQLRADLEELEMAFEKDLARKEELLDPASWEIEEKTVRLRKTDLIAGSVGLLWIGEDPGNRDED